MPMSSGSPGASVNWSNSTSEVSSNIVASRPAPRHEDPRTAYQAGDPVAADHWRAKAPPSARSASPTAAFAHIGQAVRWIRDHYTQSFRVQDVAQLAGMSVSAFRRNFQPVTTMSPIQFQKQIRLQEARLLLARTKATSRASATASVTTALAVQP